VNVQGFNPFQLMLAVLGGKRPEIFPEDDMPHELLQVI
jgi:hypothetical protein